MSSCSCASYFGQEEKRLKRRRRDYEGQDKLTIRVTLEKVRLVTPAPHIPHPPLRVTEGRRSARVHAACHRVDAPPHRVKKPVECSERTAKVCHVMLLLDMCMGLVVVLVVLCLLNDLLLLHHHRQGLQRVHWVHVRCGVRARCHVPAIAFCWRAGALGRAVAGGAGGGHCPDRLYLQILCLCCSMDRA